jgi:hypothetical protein
MRLQSSNLMIRATLIQTKDSVCHCLLAHTHSHLQPYESISNLATEQDEAEAIDKSNILKGGRTRGARPANEYTEPDDEAGLPVDDGTSGTR